MSPVPPSRNVPALIAVCLGGLAMPWSFTGPAVALPAIAASVGGSPVALSWVTNAFMLTFGGSLMAAGALADACGRKRLFLGGLALFVATALAMAAARDILWLDLLRAAQGLGSAATLAAGISALAQLFDGRARLRAFSLVGTSFGAGLSFGPPVSGALVGLFGWPGVPLFTALIGAVAGLLGLFFLKDSRDPGAGRFDWGGAFTFSLALALLTFAVLLAPELGWGSRTVLALLAGTALALALFVAVERRRRQPMLDLSLFRYPRFVGVQLLAAAPACSFVVLLVLLPLRLIGIEGHDGATAGGMVAVMSAPLLVLPVLAGLAAHRVPAGHLCGGGLLIAAAGLWWLGSVSAEAGLGGLAPPLLLIGAGIALPWGLMDGLAVSVVPTERAGMAAGIFSTARVAGEGLALAVVGAVLAALIAARIGRPDAAQHLAVGDLAGAAALLPDWDRTSLAAGYLAAFGTLMHILAGVTVLAAAAILGFLGRRSRNEPAFR